MEHSKVDNRFSVLMSVYNRDNPLYLDESLTSIWDHQILKPLQIVLVLDGTLNDQLMIIVRKWEEKLSDKLCTVPILNNIGLAGALNMGLKRCANDIVARMDADDIALPNRFQKQLAYAEANPNISFFSCWIEEFDQNMEISQGVRKVPEVNLSILKFAKKRNPLNHPATVFRKTAVESVGGYPLFKRAQDYALWSVMLKGGLEAANIQEVLLKMRTGDGLLKRRGIYHFKQEFKLLVYQRNIGFLNNIEFFNNTLLRFLFRVQPTILKRLLYKVVKS